jgi:hypothetical protein
MVLCGSWYNMTLLLQRMLLLILIKVPTVQPQITAFANDTSGTINSTDHKTNLSSLDKIIISTSCGIFMGLMILFVWNLCEIRRYIAKQHRLLLRNNTSGSFPHHSAYDPNGAESTTSDNDDGVVGHYTVTSAVTSSSSSNDNQTHQREIVTSDVEAMQLQPQHEMFKSPQAATISDFPFLYVDSPDFNALVPSSHPDDIVQPSVDTDPVQYPGTGSFDTTFVNESAFTNNDTGSTHQCEDTFIDAEEVDRYATTPNDEEFSIPSATTAFDVLSVGNVSLEHSMASSVMK